MSDELGTLALAVIAWIGFALATSFGCALAWPALRRPLLRVEPERRARWLLALAAAPTIVPLLLLALCLAPGFMSLVGLREDHCLRQAGHVHLCFAHPRLPLTPPLGALLAASFAALVASGARGARRLARWHRELAGLRLTGGAGLAPGVRRIESERPFSVTLGLWRPEIVVSTALVESLSPGQLAIVLDHERAHARRRDSLWRLVAAVLSRPHAPGVRRALLSELAVASEQACDEAAGRHGDRLDVAETILAVERLLGHGPPHPSLAGFGGSAVEERVRSLLAPRATEPPQAGGWWVGALLALGAMLLAHPLHHLTEHLLDLLLRAL